MRYLVLLTALLLSFSAAASDIQFLCVNIETGNIEPCTLPQQTVEVDQDIETGNALPKPGLEAEIE